MSVDKQKSLQAMRTFARDLDRERGDTPKSDEPTPAPAPVAKVVREEMIVVKKETPKPHHHSPTVHTRTIEPEIHEKKPEKIEHIPAFHELKKVIRTDIEVAPPKKEEKPKPDKKGINPTKAVGGGTVITDTKRVRKPFFSELSLSLQNWWKDVSKSFKPKKKNTYAVTKTERRRGVVQKATSKTGTIFSADSDTLREQIKARQRAEQREDDGEDLSWSPFTEPGFLLLEGDEKESADPRVEKVSIAFKRHSAPVEKVEAPKPAPVPVIKPTEKIPELLPPTEPVIPEPVVVPKATPAPIVEIVPEPVVEEPELETDTAEVEDVPESEVPPEDDKIELPRISFHDTNTLALLLVGLLAGIGIIAFALFAIMDLGQSDTNEEAPLLPATATYPGATLTNITLNDNSYNGLVNQTNTTLLANNQGSPVEYQYINAVEQAVPANLLMEIIQTDAGDGFAGTVTDVRLIKTGGQYRAIMMATSDTAVARGGMLNWEDSLLVDVGEILDISTEQPSASSYSDTQYGNLDVRALVRGEETLLVYAFVDSKHIIIANDISALTAFANR